MTERAVLEAMQTATIAAVAASLVPELPIKMMGRTFTPPNDQKFIEVVHIPNNITNEFWDSGRTYQGIFRLILHWPNKDEGVYAPLDLLNSVASFFTKTKSFGAVKVYDHPTLTSMIEAGSELLFPLSVPYRSFAPNEG